MKILAASAFVGTEPTTLKLDCFKGSVKWWLLSRSHSSHFFRSRFLIAYQSEITLTFSDRVLDICQSRICFFRSRFLIAYQSQIMLAFPDDAYFFDRVC